MELNGVNSYYTGYASTASQTNKDNKTSGTASANNYSDTAATYESSKGQTVSSKSTNPSLVAQLKADSDNRMQQLQSLVSKMFEKQGITIGTADDMWKVLASGNFTADADTIAKAKEDISEDGYWGVKQTSSRIFDFTGFSERKLMSVIGFKLYSDIKTVSLLGCTFLPFGRGVFLIQRVRSISV